MKSPGKTLFRGELKLDGQVQPTPDQTVGEDAATSSF
jgi:hypothetical protein